MTQIDETHTHTEDEVRESAELAQQAQPQGKRRGGRQRQERQERGPLAEIFDLIAAEVKAQDEKWGEQNHGAIGGRNVESGRRFAQTQADAWKAYNDGRVAEDTIGWDGIAYEEVFEAFAEEDPKAREIEMVQAAAVFVNAIASLRRTGL